MAPSPVGTMLRDWRHRRRRSQMAVALDAGVSPRHLSFVETGRSRPSPEVVLAIAEHLDVPLRDRNELLLAAGYAPRYPETPIGADELEHVRASIQRMLAAHSPYPGIAVDRRWDVVLANDAAALLTMDLPAHLAAEPNVYRVTFHPDGLAGRSPNVAEWGPILLDQLHRSVVRSADPGLAELEAELMAYPGVAELAGASRSAEPGRNRPLLVPMVVELGGAEVSLFTTLTTFGTPEDVTLAELCIELFYPADAAASVVLGRLSV